MPRLRMSGSVSLYLHSHIRLYGVHRYNFTFILITFTNRRTAFSNYDAPNMLVKANRPRLFQHLRQAYAASYKENPVVYP
jgi:hypothetical protein